MVLMFFNYLYFPFLFYYSFFPFLQIVLLAEIRAISRELFFIIDIGADFFRFLQIVLPLEIRAISREFYNGPDVLFIIHTQLYKRRSM